MPILLVAISLFSSALVAMFEQREISRERFLASEAVRSEFERMRNEEIGDVYALFNEDPEDDLLGPGTAPGSRFDVFGLDPLADAPDGLAGEVLLPYVNVAEPGMPPVWELREDMEWESLGMPRDLNRDNVVDAVDHSEDYVLLPVEARVEWVGRFGRKELRMYTLLTGYSMDP